MTTSLLERSVWLQFGKCLEGSKGGRVETGKIFSKWSKVSKTVALNKGVVLEIESEILGH